MNHAVGGCPDQNYSETKDRNVLLKLKVAIHRNKHFKTPFRSPQEFTVLNALPA